MTGVRPLGGGRGFDPWEACTRSETPVGPGTQWRVGCRACAVRWQVDRLHLSEADRSAGDTMVALALDIDRRRITTEELEVILADSSMGAVYDPPDGSEEQVLVPGWSWPPPARPPYPYPGAIG